jgi:hypothetical protein
MNTIFVLIWLFSVGYLFYFSYRYWGRQGIHIGEFDWFSFSLLVYVGIGAVAAFITAALMQDFGITSMESILPFILWDFIQLMIVILCTMLIPRLFGNSSTYSYNLFPINKAEKTFDTIVQVVSLIGSILGIISFFIDHMK